MIRATLLRGLDLGRIGEDRVEKSQLVLGLLRSRMSLAAAIASLAAALLACSGSDDELEDVGADSVGGYETTETEWRSARPERVREIRERVEAANGNLFGEEPSGGQVLVSAETARLDSELVDAIGQTRAMIQNVRFDMEGFREDIVPAYRTPGLELDRWARLCYSIIPEANAALDRLTADDELEGQPKYVREGFKNLRRTLGGLAKPPGIKLRDAPSSAPYRPPISYVPGRAARDGWLGTADWQLELTERALERGRQMSRGG